MSDPNPTRAVLLRAAEILEPAGAWMRGWYARNAQEVDVSATDHDACCWCMEGAMELASEQIQAADPDHDHVSAYFDASQAMFNHLQRSPAMWNDEHTQAEVVAALRSAADLAVA